MGLEKRKGTSGNQKEVLGLEFLKFLKWILFWNKGHREKMFSLLKSLNDKKVVITRNPRKLDIEKLFNERV